MPPKQSTHELLIKILSRVDQTQKQMDGMKTQMDGMKTQMDNMQKDVGDLKTNVKDLQKFKTVTTATLENIQSFIKRDADIIESELQQNVIKHIREFFPGYSIEDYSKKIKSISNPTKSGEKLTEFDSLYLLMARKLDKSFDRLFIIIEAKRYTTIEKINAKIKQKNTLVEIMKLARSDDFSTLTSKFKNTVLLHKLNEIDQVYLYIGGPLWEMNAFEYLIKQEKDDEFIGHIEMTSSRYSIHDRFTYLHQGGKPKR